MKYLKILTGLILIITSHSFAQFGFNPDLLNIKTYLSLDKVYTGSEFKIALKVNIEKEWHINSNHPLEDYLIPSELTIQEDQNFKLNKVVYPKAQDFKFAFSENPLSVWEGEIIVGAILKVNENVEPGTYSLIVNFDYQACNDMSCLAPTSISDTIEVIVADRKDVVNQINGEIFDELDLSIESQISTSKKKDDPISSALESEGILLGLVLVFLGGLALNLTPCVYPLIPITIGYFGGQSEGKTSRLFLMGLLFVLGMAVTYSIVGVVTSLSGAIFGALLQNPIVILLIVAIFIVLSLSMFGVYEFKVPDKLVAKAGGAKGGFFGAFFMGLTMGIVAAPCIGPFVIGLVTYVAAKGDPYFGFLMFFVLALGLGLPYLFLAIFSGKIKSLPRAGEWMEAVKHVFGFILLGMALYFLLPLLPKEISEYVLPVFGILAALILLFFDKKGNNVRAFRIFKYVFSVLIIAVSIFALVPADKNSIEWEYYSETALANLDDKKGIIIDFYADWCIPCKELDALTFSDQRVIDLSKTFAAFKADMTKSVSPEVEILRNKYSIVGVPTVLILDIDGKELYRITGFVNADEFYNILTDLF
ncbi:MAG: thioredoxin fold domain-containing protein [Ignavibacteriaceae bacterium]|nr:thioredoxin fold domain-containing protein [Ignavibacteriaceae bacterium]